MATERKFAISTTPNQPGYEATYSTLNLFFAAIGGLDLVTLDQKIIIEFFGDYTAGNYSLSGRVDIRSDGWVTSRVSDNIIIFRSAPGHEFVYPDETGGQLRGVIADWFILFNEDVYMDFVDVGIVNENTTTQQPWISSTGTQNRYIILDRCALFTTWSINAVITKQITNSIVRTNNTSASTNAIIYGQNDAAFICRNVVGVAGADLPSGTLFFRDIPSCSNCVYVQEAGTGYATGFSIAGEGYNSSTDGSASGAGSIPNIVVTDEFVSESNLHLLETSQLRGAGLNYFGNGYDKDIDRDDRPDAAWDIGADQFAGAAAPDVANAVMVGMNF